VVPAIAAAIRAAARPDRSAAPGEVSGEVIADRERNMPRCAAALAVTR